MLVKLLFDYTFVLLNERRCERHSFLSLFSPLLGGNSWSDSMRPSSLMWNSQKYRKSYIVRK